MKNILILFTIICTLCSKLNAQTKMIEPIKFPDSFELAEHLDLKKYQPISIEMLKEQGIEINEPLGVIQNKENMEPLIGDFDAEDIHQIYFQIFIEKQTIDHEGFSVVVLEFNSELALKKNLLLVDEAGLFFPVYFTINNYLISISCEERALLETISKFCMDEVGAAFYLPKRN